MENYFAKSRFTATMEIIIKEEKIAISGFIGERKWLSRVTKIPFTALLVVVVVVLLLVVVALVVALVVVVCGEAVVAVVSV